MASGWVSLGVTPMAAVDVVAAASGVRGRGGEIGGYIRTPPGMRVGKLGRGQLVGGYNL